MWRCFSILQQGRAGEADVAGIRKDLLHLGMSQPVLAAMTFIHQYEDIVPLISQVVRRGCCFELIDDRCDDVGLALRHQMNEMLAAVGSFDRLAAGNKGLPNLSVEVDPISNDYNPWILDRWLQRQCLRQHHHR